MGAGTLDELLEGFHPQLLIPASFDTTAFLQSLNIRQMNFAALIGAQMNSTEMDADGHEEQMDMTGGNGSDDR